MSRFDIFGIPDVWTIRPTTPAEINPLLYKVEEEEESPKDQADSEYPTANDLIAGLQRVFELTNTSSRSI